MKYTEKDILKVEKYLNGIIDHTEAREERIGKKFIDSTVPGLKKALVALRSIGNAINQA